VSFVPKIKLVSGEFFYKWLYGSEKDSKVFNIASPLVKYASESLKFEKTLFELAQSSEIPIVH